MEASSSPQRQVTSRLPRARVERQDLPGSAGSDGWRSVRTAITITVLAWNETPKRGGLVRPFDSARVNTFVVHGADEARAAYHAAVLALVTAGFEVEEAAS